MLTWEVLLQGTERNKNYNSLSTNKTPKCQLKRRLLESPKEFCFSCVWPSLNARVSSITYRPQSICYHQVLCGLLMFKLHFRSNKLGFTPASTHFLLFTTCHTSSHTAESRPTFMVDTKHIVWCCTRQSNLLGCLWYTKCTPVHARPVFLSFSTFG